MTKEDALAYGENQLKGGFCTTRQFDEVLITLEFGEWCVYTYESNFHFPKLKFANRKMMSGKNKRQLITDWITKHPESKIIN